MKISKGNFITGSIGVVAAAALLVGNGTFASWSDSYTDGPNDVGASRLELSVGQSGTQVFDNIEMYPGATSNEFEFLVASRDDEAVPTAGLTLQIQKLLDKEDGCTTQSETAEDNGVHSDAACSDVVADGDFARNASVRIVTSARIPEADLGDACNETLHPRTQVSPVNATLRQLFLNPAAINLLHDGPLEGGESICVGMTLGLPATAGNAVQGDSSSFNAKFTLTQLSF